MQQQLPSCQRKLFSHELALAFLCSSMCIGSSMCIVQHYKVELRYGKCVYDR
ncbi:hypothetical protein HMPREF3208_00843 [Gardnerella vaginalis]|uniref:Uncharacterized protein n=1 Tax=Gardnerella vaginalis TaxID=2702 RepID=A0A133NVE0_GARVA|nr:hypothetical protein HMPREF3208_00843 [Gardnerella vaginalis]